MPEGIIAEIDGGFATLDFVDRSLRGPALQKLLEIGGPETIETLTRSGPRRQYRVPEGNAREAGLIDEAGTLVRGDTGSADRLASAGQTTGSPEATSSRNVWSTGREPVEDLSPISTSVEGENAPEDDDEAADDAPLTVTSDEPTTIEPATPAVLEPTPAETKLVPTDEWKLDDLRAYARAEGIDLDGARSKADTLARIQAAQEAK
ncbi:hypothetical protein FDJ57_gp16 [Gordonia phage Sour]|uniref:Uncharacterized protein n=1 Tax=Gordonia phage Sour TaxID=2182349 RepID=A0A2U8UKM0_9CAUD|nr:hypothetical protein FDJ57_gp16 [Gordonia phage Sour]AWN04217.1 hypothetical protein PBI_SOUR_16 [Gordonia phage Sour]